jgi:ABC-2 type transport system permease protein
MRRVYYITLKEFVQVFRDPRMLMIIFIAPVLQLFLFGYAVTMDVNNITMAVMDRDHSQASRDLESAIFNSGYFQEVGSADSDRDVEASLVNGLADMVLIIPRDFERDLVSGRGAKIQVLLDGAESNSAAVGMGYLQKTLASYTENEIQARLALITARTGGAIRSLPLVTGQSRFRFNPELKSSFFFVPGVIAMILMITTMLLTGLAITREREIGTIEQLVVTPIKPYQLILGKMLPFTIIGIADITLILVVGVGHFRLPMNGSVGLLYLAALVFLFSTLGMGLLVSTVSHTQQQAIFVIMLVIMPAVLLSGLMFPIANMPKPVQWLTYLNPLRYFLVILRGVILKGNTIMELIPQFFLMLSLGLILFTIAVTRFRKTIE